MRVSPRVRSWIAGPRSDPSLRVRYWTGVERRSPGYPAVRAARKSIGRTGWAASLLAHQLRDGQWVSPGTSPQELVRPRFTSTHWVCIVLADLGMTRTDPRIRKAANLLLEWRRQELRAGDGELCFGGNATRTLIQFGYLDHPVVQESVEWIARTQKKDGGWNCFPSSKGTLDGWEGLAALAEIPESERSDEVRRSIERGAEFYLQRHLSEEGPDRYPPWFRIHYPNHFFYDVLVGLRLLTRLGYGSDPRLGKAVRWLLDKRRPDGTWALDSSQSDWDPRELARYGFPGPEYPIMLEAPGVPSRWATVEALVVLRRIGTSA
jgi:hypothetical protein